MTQLSDIRTDLRRELQDEDPSNYRWTNDELDRHIRRAVVEYSRASPRQRKTTLATVAASRGIDISATVGDDLVQVLAVEYPTGKFPPRYQRFAYYDGTVTLVGDDVPDGCNCYLYWGSVHTLVDGVGTTCTIPEKDQETVITGAAAYAALAWATHATNRVNLGGDSTPAQFLRWANARYAQYQKDLKRLRSHLRSGRLYTPQRPIESQTTDWGP